MNSFPALCIPIRNGMSSSEDDRIKFRARHAATDFPVSIEAHKLHTIGEVKRHLIEHMGYPLPTTDGQCKILAVANKATLIRDEPIHTDKSPVNERYLGGSIDHLTLQEYGLTNNDYIMFLVTFPQLNRA